MVLKKRGAIYSVVALMLCVAVYLNWSYSRNEKDFDAASNVDEENKVLGQGLLVNGVDAETDTSDSPDAAQVSGDYFSVARLSRQKARDEAVSILNSTVENTSSTEEAREAANVSIQAMADNTVRESRAENLIVAKGYKDCVVFINENGVNVIITKTEAGLTDADVAKIKDIVIGETNIAAEKIKIVETA